MSKIVIAAVLATSMLATALSASANRYIDPNAPLDGHKFFNSLPTGQ